MLLVLNLTRLRLRFVSVASTASSLMATTKGFEFGFHGCLHRWTFLFTLLFSALTEELLNFY